MLRDGDKTVYEFGAMSSAMTVVSEDPKVAVMAALIWGKGFPLVVCYSHTDASPAGILAPAVLEKKLTQAEALEAYLGQPVDDFMEDQKKAFKACYESMLPGDKEARAHFWGVVDEVKLTNKQVDAFAKKLWDQV